MHFELQRMNTAGVHRPPLRATWAVMALVAALGASTALAASKETEAKRYQRERSACAALKSVDARANCLSDASTRYASSQPVPAEEQRDVLARNALRRCEPLPDAERKDCVSRIQGQGTVSGSVEAGGIYRELVIRSEVVPEGTK